MSKVQVIYSCFETILDEEGHIIQQYEKNLPHHNIIKNEMVKSWNDAHMEQFFDGELKDKIQSAIMTFRLNKKKESQAVITIETVKDYRLSERRRNMILDQIDAQFSDGWGEGFFGYINIMTAPDGTKFIVE